MTSSSIRIIYYVLGSSKSLPIMKGLLAQLQVAPFQAPPSL